MEFNDANGCAIVVGRRYTITEGEETLPVTVNAVGSDELMGRGVTVNDGAQSWDVFPAELSPVGGEA